MMAGERDEDEDEDEEIEMQRMHNRLVVNGCAYDNDDDDDDDDDDDEVEVTEVEEVVVVVIRGWRRCTFTRVILVRGGIGVGVGIIGSRFGQTGRKVVGSSPPPTYHLSQRRELREPGVARLQPRVLPVSRVDIQYTLTLMVVNGAAAAVGAAGVPAVDPARGG